MGNDTKRVNWAGIIPIILILGIVPLIAHLKIVQSEAAFYKSFNLTTNFDFYSYYKMLFFLVFAGFSLLILVVKFIASDIAVKRSYIYFYIAAFSLLSLFSYLLSKNRDISSWGYYGRYEGIVVLIAYMFIFFYTINAVNSEKDVWFILYSVIFSSIIIGLIGISQFLGHDVLQTNFAKHLMALGVSGIDVSKIRTTLEKYVVYATLYHSDYVGSFTALVLPVFFSLCFLLKERKNKILFGAMSLLMLVTLIGSRSRTGLVAAAASLIIFLVFRRKVILNKWKYTAALAAGVIVLLLIMNKTTGGSLFKKIFSINIDTRISFNTAQIDNITTYNNTITVATKNNILNIIYSGNGVDFKDSSNKALPSKFADNKIILSDSRYKDFSFQLTNSDNIPLLVSYIGDVKLVFASIDGGIKLLNAGNQLDGIHEVKSFGFEGKEQFASSRGYIWSRSLPMLKDTLFIGHGPDTYALYFPQDDYVGKIKAYGTINMIIDKPHDLYLQTALNTGALSLIALLGIFVSYIIQSFKLYFKCEQYQTNSIFGISILMGIIGYLAAAIFNDSVVSVAPVFWILLGVGISINLKEAGLRNKARKL